MNGGGGGGGYSRRSFSSVSSTMGRKKSMDYGGLDASLRRPLTPRLGTLNSERTVKKLRLRKAHMIQEDITVQEACRQMAANRVDAVLVVDSNKMLCGILTDKDITMRVIAPELKLDETPVSKVMTRSPVFVLSDTLAVEALQKMVQGRFRHLPVLENGEINQLLDIAKCLYDAITRMERAAEKGKAIAAAVEGVEKHWGTSNSGSNTFVETIRERLFKPTLSTIIPENSKIVTVSPNDSVLTVSKKMLEHKLSSAIVTVDNKPLGILTSRDILMRVIAPQLSPASTPVEKVMTSNPECGTTDTPIVDALHTMHNGNFLHLPVVDREGNIVSVVDVIHVTHAAVATVGSTAGVPVEATNTMMQKFWDSAMTIGPLTDDDDTQSEGSVKLASEITEAGRYTIYPPSGSTIFGFKLQDRKGRMHRFNCDTQRLADLITCILQRAGDDIDRNNLPQILYEDEDHDKVVLASDNDLAAAVEHARQAGWKGLKLHLEYLDSGGGTKRRAGTGSLDYAQRDAWTSAYNSVAAGVALVAGLGFMAYLKRAGS